jgi:MmyB-like transcription regulator ligand binding domain
MRGPSGSYVAWQAASIARWSDMALTDLVGELSTRSEEFRTRWAAHNVRLHRTGRKVIHHPVVGRLDLVYDTLHPSAHAGLTLLVFTAAPESPGTADALTLIATWAATLDAEAGTSSSGTAPSSTAPSCTAPSTTAD